jgi:hypothetical protein
MAVQQVESYALRFDITKRQFLLFYTLVGESLPTALPYALSPQEFCALADMFRNERPIFFNPEKQYFTTTAEPVGEGEAESQGPRPAGPAPSPARLQ